jgi:hypothetical protein
MKRCDTQRDERLNKYCVCCGMPAMRMRISRTLSEVLQYQVTDALRIFSVHKIHAAVSAKKMIELWLMVKNSSLMKPGFEEMGTMAARF